jgi:N-acyl-D-amino-acid deacylase
MIDQYPYTASNTGIAVLIPSWAMADGPAAFKARIAKADQRAKIRAEIIDAIMTDRGAGDVSKVQFASVPWKRDLEGRTLADWCVERGMPASPENAADLVMEAQANGGCVCIFHAMDDADVERIMRHPMTMVASDGRLAKLGVDQPHPRCYGTFPRVLARYVREKKLLSLEAALNKMTGMPARRLGLKDRGVIVEGNWADVVVFDPATISDESTFKNPHQYPKGISFVFVNGIAAVDDGRFVGVRAGQVLRSPAAQATK